jgi:hypothetical protein
MSTALEEKAETHHASLDGSDEQAHSTDVKSRDQEAAAPASYIPQSDEEYVVTL